MAGPALQYAKTCDGVAIAYFALGSGPPLLFASNIWGDAHLYAHGHDHTRGMTDRLVALGWRVIRHDVRGMGASDHEVPDASLTGRARDVEAVADHLGLRRFALAGIDASAATAIAFAAEHPERVGGLVLLNAWTSGRQRMTSSAAARSFVHLRAIAANDWEYYTLLVSSLVTEFSNPSYARQLAAAFRSSASAREYDAYWRATEAIEVGHLLPRLSMPTLVLQDRGFPFAFPEASRRLAAAIPGARLVVITADLAAEVAAIHSFLLETLAPDEAPRRATAAAEVSNPDHLTPREIEVLRLIARGKTNREISEDLVLSPRTVARHITNIYAKIGARHKAEATAYAFRHGLA